MIWTYFISNIKGRKNEMLTSLLILILVGAVISASFFYIHNSSNLLLQQKLEENKVDAWIELLNFRVENGTIGVPLDTVKNYIQDNFDFVKCIVNVTTGYAYMNMTIEDEWYPWVVSDFTSILVVDENFMASDVAEFLDYDHSPILLKPNEVLLNSESYYIWYTSNIIGTNITFLFNFGNTSVIYPATIVGFFDANIAWQYRYSVPTFLLSTQLFREIASNWTDYNDNLFIQFDHSSINTENWEQYQQKINDFARSLRREFSPFINVKLPINTVFEEYSSWHFYTQSWYFIYLVPVIILGWVILKFDYELTSIKRRRELSTLKSRGFSNTSLLIMSGAEILFYSVIAAIVSLPLGNLSSLLFLQYYGVYQEINVVDMFVKSYSYPYYFEIVFSAMVFINMLSLMPIIFLTLTSEIAEARTYTAYGYEKIRITASEILALILYLPMTAFIFFLFPIFQLFTIALLAFIFYLVYILLKAFAKISAGLKFKLFKVLRKGFSDATTVIIKGNVQNRTKIPGYSIAILALVLTFAFATTATFAMTANYAHDISYYYAGADISFEVLPNYANQTPLILNITKEIDGVANVSLVRSFVGIFEYTARYGRTSSYITTLVIDDNFLNVLYHEEYFLPVKDIETILKDNKSIMVPLNWKIYMQNTYNHRLSVIINETGIITIPVKIRAYNNYFPRIAFNTWSRFIVISDDYFKIADYNVSRNYIFVAVEENVDPENVSAEIENLLAENITGIRVAQESYETIQTKVENLINYGMLSLTTFYMIVLLSLGQIIFYMDQVEHYRKEYSVLKALGFDRKQFSKLFSVDIITNFLGSIILAISLALLYAYYISSSVLNLPLDISPLVGDYYYPAGLLPVEFIIPYWDWLSIALVALVALLIVIIPIVLYIQKLNISQELKYEFG